MFTDEVTDYLPEPVKIFTKTMEESLQIVEFTTEVISKKLLQLKLYKAPGVDNLSSTMLCEVVPAIAFPISEIFVESMARGEVPVDWKSTNVTPHIRRRE